jgi:hypothetical protein
MANARAVLEVAIDEAALLANTGGTLDQIRPILNLARTALHAGDGEVPDEEVRQSGLRPTEIERIGL